MYSDALVPLTVGSAAAYLLTGLFSARRYFVLLASSVLVITWLNLSVMNHFPFTGIVLSASVLVGFMTALILFCSHFHQVRVGTKKCAEVVKVEVTMLYALLAAFGLSGALPLTCIFLCALTLLMGNMVVRFVQDNHKDKQKIFMAKYFCVRLHALFGVALACPLVVARMVDRAYISIPIFP